MYHEAIISQDVSFIGEMYKQHEVSRLMRLCKAIGTTFASFVAVPEFYYELKWEMCGCKLLNPIT